MANKQEQPNKKQGYSLKNMLTLWFLVFSITPLILISVYSLFQFQVVFNQEQHQRLVANFKEISNVFNELEDYLIRHSQEHVKDSQFISALSSQSLDQMEDLIRAWMKTYSVSQISVFDTKGASLLILFKDRGGEIQKSASGVVYLPTELQEALQTTSYRSFRDLQDDQGMQLAIYSKIVQSGRPIGFVQEVKNIDRDYLKSFKKRLNLDLVILDEEYNPIVATQKDLGLQSAWFFKRQVTPRFFKFFDHIYPSSVSIHSIDPERERIFLGLTVVKLDTENTVVDKVSKALLTGVGVIIIFLLVMLLLTSHVILQPIYDLVGATKDLDEGKFGTQIAVKGVHEIRVLIEMFNKMSAHIAESIYELEKTNKELQEMQAQLVHSAKMSSLGQLVAGVAHELNNPIGFIHSNMTHLKAYAEHLVELADLAQKNPKKVKKFKEDIDYDYILKDLPKLIQSCQEGAERLKNIVADLRTFSRLDDNDLQEYVLEENLKNTLNLLSGEIKTRIQVHLDLKDIPKIMVQAGQINQVLMNVLSNAVGAIEDQGHIWITACQKKSKEEDPYLEITIKDDGKGIKADHIDKIFDPFFTTKDVGQGTGLGLSISHSIIQKHGGDMTVKSKEKEGTTFTIKLPVEPLTPVSQKASS